MSTVRDLTPGDVVDGPGGLFSATFIGATEHPIYGGLRLVIWRMSDGSTSLDALSPFQHVGDARRSDASHREAALREALTPGRQERGEAMSARTKVRGNRAVTCDIDGCSSTHVAEFARWLADDLPREIEDERRRSRVGETSADVIASYAATHARLANDPEYQRLKGAALQEARETPGLFIARNRLAIYVELHTPMPDIRLRPVR